MKPIGSITQSSEMPAVRPSFSLMLAVFLCSLLFYVATLAPTVIWGDSASFAIRAVQLNPGVGSDSHPLFVVLGRLFTCLPFEPAYSLNLLSAIAAALAVMAVFAVVVRLTGSIYSAIIGAASLLVSHAFWLHAVITEVYDLNAFLLMLTVLILLKWQENTERIAWLCLAAFVYALGLSNHLVIALESIGIIVFVLAADYKRVLRLKTLLLTACSFFCGSGLLIYFYSRQYFMGTAVSKLANTSTGGDFKTVMGVVTRDLFGDFLTYLAYLFYQFPLIGFLLGFMGIYFLFRKNRRVFLFLLLLLLINAAFFISFGPGRKATTKYTFYISDYALFAVLIGCGAQAFARFVSRMGQSAKKVFIALIIPVIACPLILYSAIPALSKSFKLDLLHARKLAYRDNEKFFLFPGKRGYTGPADYAGAVFGAVPPNSIVLLDYSPFRVLDYYQKIHGTRKDVLVLMTGLRREDHPDKIVKTYYGKRDIYVGDITQGYYVLDKLQNEYDFVPEGVLYKVVKK